MIVSRSVHLSTHRSQLLGRLYIHTYMQAHAINDLSVLHLQTHLTSTNPIFGCQTAEIGDKIPVMDCFCYLCTFQKT